METPKEAVVVLAVSLLLYSCTTTVHVDKASKNMHTQCTDIRDKETFSFWTHNISEITVGYFGADTCIYAVDDNNKERVICKSHDAFIKCKEL